MEGLNLLLVEDNPGDAFLIQEMLAESETPNFYVETYAELSPALSRLASEPADAVLLDLSLPDSHGLETVRRVMSQTTSVPIVVLTGLDDQNLGLKAVQEGAQDYLVKGDVSARLLRRALHYAVERHRIDQERKSLIADLEAFAHTVAHDLKGPLTPLVMVGDVLETHAEQLEVLDVETYGALIVRNAKMMGNIVDELLMLASVRRDEVRLEVVDMEKVFARALTRLDHLIDSEQAEIHAPERWPAARGYGPWLEEVWANYVSNAIKFGGKPPVVEVGATERGNNTVCYWVQDNGPGIPKVLQERLFTPFTRLDQARAKGHGLGLSIVQRIVEKLGGRVELESAPGQGSRFAFTLTAAG